MRFSVGKKAQALIQSLIFLVSATTSYNVMTDIPKIRLYFQQLHLENITTWLNMCANKLTEAKAVDLWTRLNTNQTLHKFYLSFDACWQAHWGPDVFLLVTGDQHDMTGVVHRKVLTVKMWPKLLFSSSTPCWLCPSNWHQQDCRGQCKPWSCASATVQHLHQGQSPEVFIPNSAWKIHRYSTSIITTEPFPQMPCGSTPALPTRSKIFETFLNKMYRKILQEPDGGRG